MKKTFEFRFFLPSDNDDAEETTPPAPGTPPKRACQCLPRTPPNHETECVQTRSPLAQLMTSPLRILLEKNRAPPPSKDAAKKRRFVSPRGVSWMGTSFSVVPIPFTGTGVIAAGVRMGTKKSGCADSSPSN